jgi:hypothetical protein
MGLSYRSVADTRAIEKCSNLFTAVMRIVFTTKIYIRLFIRITQIGFIFIKIQTIQKTLRSRLSSLSGFIILTHGALF